MKRTVFLFICLTIGSFLSAQTPAQLADSMRRGFRGLSIASVNVIWLSGQKGLVGHSYSAGSNLKWYRVKGFEKSDFRSIHAFDKKNAVIATAGFPAAILFTTNAGKSWTTSYISKDSAMFFDGLDFWDRNHGLIFGDPVNGRMYLSETFDGGKTWKEIPFADRPQLQEGEASFAASGTTIRVLPDGHVYIATGGTVSRLWHSRDYGHHWEVFNTPILQGKSSQGIFSLAFSDTLNGIIVGGDYTKDTMCEKNCFITNDGGKTWRASVTPPKGYRSCVEILTDSTIITTGTSGTDISFDYGLNWITLREGNVCLVDGDIWPLIDSEGFNTVREAPGSGVFFCGSKKAKFARIECYYGP